MLKASCVFVAVDTLHIDTRCSVCPPRPTCSKKHKKQVFSCVRFGKYTFWHYLCIIDFLKKIDDEVGLR